MKKVTNRVWIVDGGDVCEDCFDAHFSDMAKCIVEDCDEYDDPDNFVNGMCEPCLEVNTPLDPEEQQGWEEIIENWNKG
ncbi:hypothetical protein F6455_13010 [Proteobacteria bacterium 005FR1]|nr:hypothetical protein [Proteobacteria bacterium 005FR1]